MDMKEEEIGKKVDFFNGDNEIKSFGLNKLLEVYAEGVKEGRWVDVKKEIEMDILAPLSTELGIGLKTPYDPLSNQFLDEKDHKVAEVLGRALPEIINASPKEVKKNNKFASESATVVKEISAPVTNVATNEEKKTELTEKDGPRNSANMEALHKRLEADAKAKEEEKTKPPEEKKDKKK
jgi:hypothetical protein